jgi:phthalate 4,5-dioxygenase
MLSREDNALMCDVEGDTPMHRTLERYWLPILPTAEVTPDGDPVKVTVMGKHYVVFRDSTGRVGVLNERCAHRGASLCLGRVEYGGIRCIYHGWKYDVMGKIQEMPNFNGDPPKSRYRQPAYPAREAANAIWAYFGPTDKQPPFPKYPVFDLPSDQVVVQEWFVDANFVQLMEGLVDSSHVGVLHQDAIARRTKAADEAGRTDAVYRQMAQDLAPNIDCRETEFGFHYAALRKLKTPEGEFEAARITAFALPFINFSPNNSTMLAGVPVGNGRTQMFEFNWDWERPFDEQRREQVLAHHGIGAGILDRFGISRRTYGRQDRPNWANNYMQDREAMRRGETFSGLPNFQPEDVAIATSQGAISDRTTEHLLPSDQAVVRMRRVLIESARRVMQDQAPIGVETNIVPHGIQGLVRQGQPWETLLKDESALRRSFGQFAAELKVTNLLEPTP